MSDEHDAPIFPLFISEQERTALLTALWNDHLRQQNVNAPLVGTEHEFATMMMFQNTFDLVRKLGGNPAAPGFGLTGS